jgi:hypothetical protein
MEAVCGFCGERPVVAWFEGPDFQRAMDSPDKLHSQEAWLACAVCLALVEADDREAVVRRRLMRIARKDREDPGPIGYTLDLFAAIERGLKAEFWARRATSS